MGKNNKTTETEIPLKNMGRIEEGTENPDPDAETVAIDNRRRKRKHLNSAKFLKISGLLLLLVIAALLIAYFIYYYVTQSNPSEQQPHSSSSLLIPPNPEVPQPPSPSTLQIFENGAVCSDSDVCSKIGRDILHRSENAVDSALATLFCNGITTMQSLGIGGGFIMNVFIKQQNQSYTFDAREVAPLAATESMFVGKPKGSAMEGPQSIAVPGEVMGYWEAHHKFGTMPWKELIEPSIKVCEDGFILSQHMHDSLLINPRIKNDLHLRKTFVNERTGEYFSVGMHVKPPKELCQTYRLLARNGGPDFYNGTLARMIVEDLQEIGSIITADDLKNYRIELHRSEQIYLGNNSVMHIVPPVGSGYILGFIMNILQGYHFSPKNLSNKNETILTYHRFIEAFKFAYAKRSELGDMRFNNITELLENLKSRRYADAIRQQIDDNKTFNDSDHYGAKYSIKKEYGTSHLSVLARNGDAVSVTSSVNYYFGSGHSGRQTGIIFNSGMDDFSTPGLTNYFGLPSSKPNYIKPGKRAMSSMSPTIVTGTDGNVKLVVGASGGSKIITALAWAIARVIWFGDDIKQAIDAPRIHHQLVPNEVEYEFGTLQEIVEGLESKGHKMKRYRERGSVICGLAKNKTSGYANADYRKRGDVFGL